MLQGAGDPSDSNAGDSDAGDGGSSTEDSDDIAWCDQLDQFLEGLPAEDRASPGRGEDAMLVEDAPSSGRDEDTPLAVAVLAEEPNHREGWDAADPYSPLHLLPVYPHPIDCLATLQGIQRGLFYHAGPMALALEMCGRVARTMHLPEHWGRSSVYYVAGSEAHDYWLVRPENEGDGRRLLTLRHYLLLRTDPDGADRLMATRFWTRPEVLVRNQANGCALIMAVWIPQLAGTLPSLRGGITIDNIPADWDGTSFYPPLAVVPSLGGPPATPAMARAWRAAVVERAEAIANAHLQEA
jgi:hypothetical protein